MEVPVDRYGRTLFRALTNFRERKDEALFTEYHFTLLSPPYVASKYDGNQWLNKGLVKLKKKVKILFDASVETSFYF